MADAKGIRRDPALFQPIRGHEALGIDSSLMVVCDQPDKAARALARVVPRATYVGDNGREYIDDEEVADALEAGVYTPNFCGDVLAIQEGPAIILDTKGEMPPLMGDALVRIVTEELLAEGVTDAVITSTPDDDDQPHAKWNFGCGEGDAVGQP